MRNILFLMPLALLATPAAAAPPPVPQQIQIPPELTDPATIDRLGNMMQALSKAFLNLPVGEIEAAAEGRRPTRAERKLTVRDMARRDDPDFDRNFERQIAQAGPMMKQSMKAFGEALPRMSQSMSQIAEELERVAANMPQPMDPQP
jgi:hypothetical protein